MAAALPRAGITERQATAPCANLLYTNQHQQQKNVLPHQGSQ
eukprot:CAMPEP_0171142704 /NCGR_PEP_ID=MMETSP0766_2-20121228/143024_1 /TAXON_ID=439317 /ORGANISM="Gambierdiscus australes, Strain CAWD 149" /LENGTH=41 /DNA_ID= /DNA_START= /DNA_END= /DNA_ORIENTATION=